MAGGGGDSLEEGEGGGSGMHQELRRGVVMEVEPVSVIM